MVDSIDTLFSPFSLKQENEKSALHGPAKRCKTSSDATSATLAPLVEEDNYQDVLIETYDSDINCSHDCVRPLPKNDKEIPNVTSTKASPAMEFPYELDLFQKKAIQCLEKGESVLVSAHTSAGKTTVAEYAIAMSLRDNQRVIYTSPIKALSNQKFRDLSNVYGKEVGLLTGDVSLNPSASIVVMTTEILRSMLYRGSKMIREIKWVIFDEIHYMRDRDRGVVWEETIILLPDTVRLIFLSATIPNAREFIEWICRIKNQPCHAIYTDYRPVPLQHYLFPLGGECIYLVMDEKKIFNEDQFYKAASDIKRVHDTIHTETNLKKHNKPKSDIERIILMCHEKCYTPLIIFAFSRREVEANALKLKDISLTTQDEEELIEKVFNNAMDTLGDDRSLPQITCILPLLKKGIGLHHGGLLPIVKEVIEILFQESLIKVLFSTETFSMGVNMPAKTVIFTKLRKFDGCAFRMISPGEYIQMSGRAGRRGLDTQGICIIMLDEQLEADVAKELFMGKPLRIDSQFHLSYNMVLNLLRVEGATPEHIIALSFFQFQKNKSMDALLEKKKILQKQLSECEEITNDYCQQAKNDFPNDFQLHLLTANYYRLQHSIETLKKKLHNIIMQPKHILRFLQVGRVIRVNDSKKKDLGYGILTQPALKASSQSLDTKDSIDVSRDASQTHTSDASQFVVSVLVKSVTLQEETSWTIVKCSLENIREITQVVANVPKRLQNVFPLLNPNVHMKISDPALEILQKEIEEKTKQLEMNPIHPTKHLPILISQFEEKLSLTTDIKDLERTLELEKQLVMKDDLRAMRRVLKSLDYIDEKNLVSVKGRAACEVSSVDELVLCELLFQNAFHKIQTNYLVALLSCFVFDEKSDENMPNDPKLLEAYQRLRDVSQRVAEVSINARLPVVLNDYVNKFKPTIMDLTLKWMQGAKFCELGIPENMFEGAIVRSFRRLEELLRQLMAAAKTIEETDLESRLCDAVKTIRRGIPFAPSLYI
ncbi:exosome RNA helicase MTR4-like isoform X2 [Hylaeus volcanicus]|uniref:exosome RNA helicase MTR4-like isoform X2 n=1 Tax=Hylaeus volcanicus TaxID=313075 RepID=UPI0023B7B84B|nr:exosome RNA helicase MTR4-like isoform X2 [Hylaeus volcanicus]